MFPRTKRNLRRSRRKDKNTLGTEVVLSLWHLSPTCFSQAADQLLCFSGLFGEREHVCPQLPSVTRVVLAHREMGPLTKFLGERLTGQTWICCHVGPVSWGQRQDGTNKAARSWFLFLLSPWASLPSRDRLLKNFHPSHTSNWLELPSPMLNPLDRELDGCSSDPSCSSG